MDDDLVGQLHELREVQRYVSAAVKQAIWEIGCYCSRRIDSGIEAEENH